MPPLTSTASTTEVETAATVNASAAPRDEELVVEELLVEDVSIDGMCGVY